jgi:hypothetical protein
MKRIILASGVAAFALLGAIALYVRSNAPPNCGSEQALDRVSEILRDDFHLDSILMNNITTISGGFLSDRHDCSAEVTEIRGGVNASAMPWQEIRYRIVQQNKSRPPVVTVELGGNVPLAQPTPSLWKRLLAYFRMMAA